MKRVVALQRIVAQKKIHEVGALVELKSDSVAKQLVEEGKVRLASKEDLEGPSEQTEPGGKTVTK